MDWMTRVQSLTEEEDFSFNLCIQISYGVHPAFCMGGRGGLSMGVKHSRPLTPSSAKLKKE
jgi:hypothetical protein